MLLVTNRVSLTSKAAGAVKVLARERNASAVSRKLMQARQDPLAWNSDGPRCGKRVEQLNRPNTATPVWPISLYHFLSLFHASCGLWGA